MVTIKKIDDGIYEAELQNSVLIIDKHSGYQLKKEIGQIVATQREITIDLKKVDAMDKNGFKMLEQLFDLATKKNCKLHLLNFGSALSSKINSLNKTKEEVL